MAWLRNGAGIVAALTVAVGAAGGVILLGVAVAQQPKATDPGKSDVPVAPAPKDPAKAADPLGAMLADARTALGKLRDYTGTFTRQERINGTLGPEQVAEMKMRVNPAGVYVRFARPEGSAGMEVAYSGARRDGTFRYRPAGVAGRRGFLKLELDDAKFLAENRHPAAEWGMAGIIDRVATATAREKSLNNPIEVYTADYQFASRNVTRYEILTRRPHTFRYAARMVVYVDKETKLPVRFEAYDDPRGGAIAGGAPGELLEVYSFTDLKFNTGVGENTFDN